MKPFPTGQIRNLGLFAHSGAGKTSLCDAALFVTGASKRLCSVDEENSQFDTDPEEQSRRTSIGLHLGHATWKKHKLNLVDTPGDLNFQADVHYGCRAADVAVMMISAPDGVEVGTEKSFATVQGAGLPAVFVINKMDREHANFDKVVDSLPDALGVRPTIVNLPIGSADDFRGVVDVIDKKAYVFTEPGSASFQTGDVPADLADRVEELYGALVENVAETDEELMEKYFEGELTDDEVRAGLMKAVAAGEVTPVLCASARTLAGVPQLLDFAVAALPSPSALGPKTAQDDGGADAVIEPLDDGPLVAYVFKTIVDPFAGKLTCVRVRRGVFPGSGEFTNASTGGTERYSTLGVLCGKQLESVNQAHAGDIVVLSKLRETTTGHTIADARHPVTFTAPVLPPAAISFAVHTAAQHDEEKLGPSMHRLMEEDACVGFDRDPVTHELLLSGLGQAHVESIVARLKSRFNVTVTLHTPKVPYMETIRSSAKARGRHKKQSGGRGQFGDCWVEFAPNERGGGFEYIDKIVGGAIPRQFIPAVEKGIGDAMKRGYLAGYPMTDIKATCYDGSFHAVDSSDMAFQIAGSLAYKEAMPSCSPVILEPVMKMEITVPEEHMGDIIGDLNSRRGRVLGMTTKGRQQIIGALVPQAEVLKYASDLKSMTSARGTFTMAFDHYEDVPAQVQEKIIADAKAGGDDH